MLLVHAAIHLLGFAKAFAYAELPQLAQPTTRLAGVMWLVAAVLVGASATMFAAGARRFWVVGLFALIVSQAVIVSAWRDAWAGTTANLLLAVIVSHAWLTQGPRSYRAQFDRDAASLLSRPVDAALVTDADLAPLPEPVQRYLRLAGVVGQPRVHSYRIRFRGRIRSGPEARWMPFDAEQQSVTDPPARLFLMRASMMGVPVEAFHRLRQGHATMDVTVAGLFPMVRAAGPVMDRSESVTLLNDMCLLAPAALIDPAIEWTAVDARSAEARFAHGDHRIAATLLFGDDGRLVNFMSDDRSRISADGQSFTTPRFLTPVRQYRPFGVTSIAAFGEGRWLLADGEFTYGEFEVVDVAYNALRPAASAGWLTRFRPAHRARRRVPAAA